MSTLWRGLAIFALLTGLFVLAPVQPATAAGTVGTGTADSCTETALETALSNGGSVTFDCGSSAVTISVTSQKTISTNTQIDGAGLVTLSGGGTTNIFVVDATASLTLQDITLSDGSSTDTTAGAIYNQGTLSITNSTLQGNSASGQGGAIYNASGSVTISDTDFDTNTATDEGGAIYNAGTLVITGGTFDQNDADDGGAIYNDTDGSASISNVTFQGNSATWGGAIQNYYATATVIDSTFSNNGESTVGGAIYSRESTLEVTGSAFNGNQSSCGGGAIAKQNGTLAVGSSTFHNNVATASDGPACSGGAGILNSGDALTVADSTFSGNTASVGGGGIYNVTSGTVTIINSTFNNNTATDSADGGGAIAHINGTMTIIDSTLTGNTGAVGGAVDVNGGTLDIINSTLANNSTTTTSSGLGGALINYDGTVTLTASTFSDNSAGAGGAIYNLAMMDLAYSTISGSMSEDLGGGIYSSGALNVSDSTISDNQSDGRGGGIYTLGRPLTITNSTLSNNSAASGSGVYIQQSTVDITSSTLTGNSASSSGTIDNQDGTLTILSSTLAENGVGADGGALYGDGGDTSATSSIIAGNTTTGGSLANCAIGSGSITSQGYNLTDDGGCGFTATGDIQSSTNVSLGALADNGGPTNTMLPAADSAAVGAVSCSVANSEDQRGAVRPIDADVCDIGAVEIGRLVRVQLLVAYNSRGPVVEGIAATISVLAAGPAVISYDYGFDCDDDGTYETVDNGASATGSGACSFVDDGTFTVPVQVCDAAGNGNCDSGSISVTVTNTAPVVDSPTVTPSSTNQSGRTTLGGPAGDTISASNEGTSVVASATFYDPGIPDVHTCTVDYGDGSGPEPGAVIVNDEGDMDTCVGPDHIYVDDNPSGTSRDPYIVTVEVTDDAGHKGDNYTIHYVDNVPPTIDAVETDSSGDTVTISIEASDAGVEDVLTYSFDCDNDGNYETEGTENQGECSVDAGPTIGVQVVDDDLGEATSSVAVEKPAGVELCVDYLTRVVRAAGAVGCGAASFVLAMPDAAPAAFCISDGLGKLRWSYDGHCPPGQQLHIVPDDGAIHSCYTPYLGLLRVVETSVQCNAYEVANTISAAP